jgi:hypothetical protein
MEWMWNCFRILYGSVIAFFSMSLRSYKNKAFVFLKRQDKWSETEKVFEGNAEGIISDGQFKLITFGNFTLCLNLIE